MYETDYSLCSELLLYLVCIDCIVAFGYLYKLSHKQVCRIICIMTLLISDAESACDIMECIDSYPTAVTCW